MTNLEPYSRVFEKLIDALRSMTGTLYKPRAIRNEADAEAYAIEVKEKAEIKSLLLRDEAEQTITDRANNRLILTELKRQENLEKIADHSADSIKLISHDSPELEDGSENVNEDWLARFFNKAKDISTDEIQKFWGEILARELLKPSSISLRTLDILSNLSSDEAELFETLCHLVSNEGRIFRLESDHFSDFGITYLDLKLLEEAGLVSASSHSLSISEAPFSIHIGKKHYELTPKDRYQTQFNASIFLLTKAGRELSSALNISINEEYENRVIEIFTKYGFNPVLGLCEED